MRNALCASLLCSLLAACSTIDAKQLAAYGDATSHCTRNHSVVITPGPFGGWPPATNVTLTLNCDPANRVFEDIAEEETGDEPVS